jgi:hypothetical protein
MRESYPGFQCSCTQEGLIEPFPLTPARVAVVLFCRGAAKRCRTALLLEALSYLGYVPKPLAQIAPAVRTRAELLFNAACERLRQAYVELPAVGQFYSLVKAGAGKPSAENFQSTNPRGCSSAVPGSPAF